MKFRKAQLTIFIILAIILVVAGILTYFVIKSSEENYFKDPNVKNKVDLVLNSIENCRKTSADVSVLRIGLQGGYYEPPETYLDLGWMFIPFYYIEGQTMFPQIEIVQRELAKSYDLVLNDCIKSIDSGEIQIITKPAKSSAVIESNKISFKTEMDYSLSLENKKINYNLNKFDFSNEYKLYDMYEVAKYITDSHNQNPPMLCMDCLVEMANQRQLLVDFTSLAETKLITISQESEDVNDFTYQFLEKYKSETESIAEGVDNEA